MHPQSAHRGPNEAHIVCVNSSPELLEMICELLVDEGYDATPLPVASDTITEIRRISPDALVLDLVANDELSWQLIEQVNSDPATSHIPSIIVSTDPHALERVRHENRRYGGDCLLPKPFDVFELCEHLRRLLTRSSDDGPQSDDASHPPSDAG